MFCSGTAVVVTPVGKVTYNNQVHEINKNQLGPIAGKCKELLSAIQRQEIDDPFGWIKPVIKGS